MNRVFKYSLIGVVLFSLLIGGVYGALYFKREFRTLIFENQISQRMIPLYRSIRKLPDIVFMPWSAFAKSELETYELTISPRNINRINSVLPEQPFNSGMDADSKLWVPAYFRAPGYEGSVNVRYRGNQASHWNAYQKSYLIKFPNKNLFNGMKEMNLVIPSKRRYLGMPLNDFRARKLELISPDEKLVNLEVNGADTGVLLAFEGWSQAWIEKLPISALSTLYGVDEGYAPYQERWDSWNSEEPIDFSPLETLEEIVDHASDEDFKKIIPLLIDIEDWYRWDIMFILAGGYHVTADSSFGANNLVLIFERSEGRFKPVPYNTVIFTPSFRAVVGDPKIMSTPTRLHQRILSIPEFRERRDELWHEYVANEKEADLIWLENWLKTNNREFLLDNAKNDNHFMYLTKINENAETAKNHFDDPHNMISATFTPPVNIKEELDIPEEFKYITPATADALTASKQHYSLINTTDGLYIPAGNHWFDKTIIIPANTSLTIAPGATLRMKEGVSFISYSPIRAEGTELRPITITGYEPEKSWGVFAVLNTETATSSIKYVQADGGGETTINGAYISGTLAFHNSNVEITNTTVRDAKGDDGINIKGSYVEMTNNSLIENSSDGVDLDFVDPSSVFANNEFLSNQGDAIDISWSDIKINGNTVKDCGDKGISVGESSKPIIINNNISGCLIGIAVKDSSYATISENIIGNTETAVSLYQKKPYFGGGTAEIENNTFVDNNSNFSTDSLSEIIQ